MSITEFCGLDLTQPRIIGILNVTPDSFSDGGRFADLDKAVEHARAMTKAGASIIDVGGESTRPGADAVSTEEELARVIPVIKRLVEEGLGPVSIDTRKAEVMKQAAAAGALVINDVSALSHDPEAMDVVAALGLPVVLMHAQGDPRTMQDDPQYDDVVEDVYDYLAERVALCVAKGIGHDRIIVDPGIGFGKTLDHNLELLGHLDRFQDLGCPVLLGASRKSFIGKVGGAEATGAEPDQRLGGSLAAVALGLGQGIQFFRVHDVAETSQFLSVCYGIARATSERGEKQD